MSEVTDDILSRVKTFIADQRLLDSPEPESPSVIDSSVAPSDVAEVPIEPQMRPRPKIYVGLSGGADSVCLLHILKTLGYDVIATHCHFGLRGEEADRDLDFSRRFAESLGVPFVERHFDTRAYADEHKVSIEMAARELRYAWWKELRQEADIEYDKQKNAARGEDGQLAEAARQMGYKKAERVTRICVAHHQDDSVETTLMNLMRGTGIKGLTGIDPLTADMVARPLLCLWRTDVLEYIEDNHLDYVTDSTNLENDFTRNQVRNLLLPEMELINQNARTGVSETMNRLREAYDFAQKVVLDTFERDVEYLITDGCYYKALKMERHLDHREYVIYEFLRDFDPSVNIPTSWPHEICQYYQGERRKRNYVYENAHVWVGLGKNRLYRIKKPFDFNPKFEQEEVPLEDFKRDRHNETAYFDMDKIALPLSWRHWQDGDRIRPYGMKTGSKLVSDVFKDKRYTTLEKFMSWIVTDATGRVVWVTGTCTSSETAVDESTKRVWRVTHKK